ncbi:hypothetical protein [Streptomyces sp. NPDC001657]|uniref:hypothetical protein n=1 Tax=Streptomyces sp. NPDC001657 TaxID=3154522 RepID=UPI0033273055
MLYLPGTDRVPDDAGDVPQVVVLAGIEQVSGGRLRQGVRPVDSGVDQCGRTLRGDQPQTDEAVDVVCRLWRNFVEECDGSGGGLEERIE